MQSNRSTQTLGIRKRGIFNEQIISLPWPQIDGTALVCKTRCLRLVHQNLRDVCRFGDVTVAFKSENHDRKVIFNSTSNHPRKKCFSAAVRRRANPISMRGIQTGSKICASARSSKKNKGALPKDERALPSEAVLFVRLLVRVPCSLTGICATARYSSTNAFRERAQTSCIGLIVIIGWAPRRLQPFYQISRLAIADMA
jgi:hypothetical protein